MHPIDVSIADHIFFVIVGLAVPIMSAVSGPVDLDDIEFDFPTKRSVYINNSMMLWLGAGIALGIWFFHGRSFASLGFSMPQAERPAMWMTMVALFMGFYAYDTISQMVSSEKRAEVWRRWQKNTPFMPLTYRELVPYSGMAITAGICEEIMFRGFLIQYLLAMFGTSKSGMTAAIALPALVFAVSHRYQGWQAVFKILLMSILFGYIYVYTQSLWIPIVLHIIVDQIGGLIGVYVFGEGKRE